MSDAWQQIKSAPKDGTAVDLWSSRGFRLPDCEWGTISWEPDEMGWTSSQGHGSVEAGGPYTHWMPIPAPPKETP
jgi:hypothetical protein